MLMRNPKEYERVAREWAVRFAGAPKKDRGESSGGSAGESVKDREVRSREEEEKARLAM
jgi:ubiquitin-conjugating enzyme (huntingtin interacting protein 2)